jgi:hypothetical protein
LKTVNFFDRKEKKTSNIEGRYIHNPNFNASFSKLCFLLASSFFGNQRFSSKFCVDVGLAAGDAQMMVHKMVGTRTTTRTGGRGEKM